MKIKLMGFNLLLISYLFMFQEVALAIVNPLSTSNNKYGIHIISPTSDEIKSARDLVNSTGGAWGYITVVIESNDRNLNKWQTFFNELRKNHLIPIVRIATKPSGDFWQRPGESDAKHWADFLDKLNWPIKNRYVIIYNEPNHAKEWGNLVDPGSYAGILNSTIDALKNKSSDFFVLNSGFDQSAPDETPNYFDEEKFLIEMQKSVPDIFEKLDGWVSHSYPNPGFKGSPTDSGRKTISGFSWELETLKKLGVKKDLAVFITETGWKHAEGIEVDSTLPDSSKVAENFKKAFETIWDDPKIIAVTPFLLNYPQPPFDHFTFSADGSNFYPQYRVVSSLPKERGEPFLHLSKTLRIDLTRPL